MKHLFFVHSSTTFFSALGAIKHNKIESQNVIFLTSRGFYSVIMDEYKFSAIPVDFELALFSPVTFHKLLNVRKFIRHVDKFILEIIQSFNFVAYIPHAMDPLFQVFITNENCVGYNFIEEGLGSYKKELYNGHSVKISIFKKIILLIVNSFIPRVSFGAKFLKPFSKSKFKPNYFILKNEFSQSLKLKNVIYIQWQLNVNTNNAYNDILIMSPLVEFGLVEHGGFLNSLLKLLLYFKSNSDKLLYIKFHPSQYTEIISDTIKLINENGIQYKIIDKHISIEELLLNNKGLNLYGFESSLLFYGSILSDSNKVYTVYEYMINNNLFTSKNEILNYKYLFSKMKQL